MNFENCGHQIILKLVDVLEKARRVDLPPMAPPSWIDIVDARWGGPQGGLGLAQTFDTTTPPGSPRAPVPLAPPVTPLDTTVTSEAPPVMVTTTAIAPPDDGDDAGNSWPLRGEGPKPLVARSTLANDKQAADATRFLAASALLGELDNFGA